MVEITPREEKLALYLWKHFGSNPANQSWEELEMIRKELYYGHASQILDVVLELKKGQ